MATPIPGATSQVFDVNNLPKQNSAAKTADNALGKDAFLKLLVAQLKYQDPLNPADPQQFMSQTAQFTQVEKLEELSATLKATAISTGISTASALLGKSVSFANGDNTISTGVVSAISSTADGVTLKVGDKSTTLDKITTITNPEAPAAAN